MLTEFLRDQAFAIAWLAVMGAGWLGWAQEDPRPRLRPVLGAGSVLGILLAGAFGVVVARNWGTPTALEGSYWVFGLVVLAEAVLIGVGCIVLARRGQTRWYGWWIGLCVALHFIPLAYVFSDWSYVVLSAVQVVGLVVMRPTLQRASHPTSRWACAWVGATFLLYALISAVTFLIEHGYPVAAA